MAGSSRPMRAPLSLALALLAACSGSEPPPPGAPAARTTGVQRVAFESAGQRLVVEVLDDDLVHFELAAARGDFSPERPLFASPMIAPVARRGPRRFERRGARLVTGELVIGVSDSLCVDVATTRGDQLARFCPAAGPEAGRLTIAAQPGANAYGLGQSCLVPGMSGGDWSGRMRRPGGEFGNLMPPFDGGACGDTQFPVLYALGRQRHVALFLDDVRAQTWDLRRQPWSVTTPSRELRWYVMAGETPLDLRADYMELTGRPPVPPRAAFGLWVSEYGFEDWRELDEVLAGLRRRRFPVDGFVLDLQWFGGILEGSPYTSMGKLAFDTSRFPDPAKKLAELRDRHGAGIMLIEESFVGGGLPEHAQLAQRGFLARRPGGEPVRFVRTWWGEGGMIDWSNPAAGDFWHDWKRRPLVELGVVGHWTDLGEPEAYEAQALYHGFAGIGRGHASVHNLYNLAWAASIERGYRRQGATRRPFVMSRSGAPGIQRLGVAMWSGDLGSRFTTLATQARNQLHMSMSGVDYYGSDVGGFWRKALPPGADIDELYTQWLANSAMTEVPLRPHTFNLDNAFETSPDRIGHRASNLAAVRLRYALVPYLYSLAHLAHRSGEPVFPPLLLHYPDDPAVRTIGDQKLLGRDLMAVLAIGAGRKTTRVYLPAGTWYDFHTGQRHDSRGQWLDGVPLRPGGRLRLPLYARAGAIIPMQRVDRETMNAAGRRLDGEKRDELRLRVFPSAASRFTVFEDDGESTAYLRGEVRETTIAQHARPDVVIIDVEPARGDYRGAAAERALALEVVGTAPPTGVEVDGRALPRASEAALSSGREGWAQVDGRVVVVAPAADVRRARQVRIPLQQSQ
jgi:alpha-glucosidase (family GH31 glycosyl hydrolase)